MGIPWPNVLGRREWDCRAGVDGAGDWERGEGAVDEDWGGPLAQADLAGRGVGFFGADAVEDLLILQRDERLKKKRKKKEKKKHTNCCKNNELLIFFVNSCGFGRQK